MSLITRNAVMELRALSLILSQFKRNTLETNTSKHRKWLVGILFSKQMSKFMWWVGPLGQIKHPNNLKWGGRICVSDHSDLYAAFWLFFNNCLSFPCYWRNDEILIFFPLKLTFYMDKLFHSSSVKCTS